MNSIPSEAVQAAAEALAGGPGDDFDRESAVAALTAALPHLKTHIIRELAQEADSEALSARDMTFTTRMFGGHPFPDMSHAGSAHRWLEARLAKEQP